LQRTLPHQPRQRIREGVAVQAGECRTDPVLIDIDPIEKRPNIVAPGNQLPNRLAETAPYRVRTRRR
jgi:hypothetical protein